MALTRGNLAIARAEPETKRALSSLNARGVILDPTTFVEGEDPGPSPEAGSLAGKTVGIRLDTIWRSWDWVTELWAKRIQEAGAKTMFLRTHNGRSGAEGAEMEAQLKAFFADSDVVISGLGNCGSCTSWVIRDALAAIEAGRPTIAVVTAQFEQLATSLSRRSGRPKLRMQILPYPLDVLPKEQVDVIAGEFYEPFLRSFGVRG